ncbi:MAG: hypothetical protein AB7I32_21080, partial [Gammaproteobacteria bacterium]
DRALTLTVMTQVYVSRARLAIMLRELQTARSYAATQASLLRHIRAEHAEGRISEQTLLREELNDVVGQVRKHLASANVESARAAVAASIGSDPPDYGEAGELEPGNASAWRARVVTASHGKR